MGRPCRCCCAKWTHRRIAVPSGEHIATYKMGGKDNDPPGTNCHIQECVSLNRWPGGRWGAAGSYWSTVANDDGAVKVYSNASALLHFKNNGPDYRIAVGPSGEFATRGDGTFKHDPGYIWDAAGVEVAVYANWSGAIPLPRGIGADDLGQWYLPFFSAGVGNGILQVASDGTGGTSFIPTSIAPQDSGFASNYDYLRRPRFDAGNKWVCGSLRAYDTLTPSSPVINHLGWVGSGGGVIWRIKNAEALADGDMNPPCWLECYSTSDASTLTNRIAGFYPFNESGSPVAIRDCDVDSTGRIALLGETTSEQNVAVYDKTGTEIMRVGFGANLISGTWYLQSDVYAICWGPNDDEVIVGGRAAEYPGYPHP